MGKRQAVVEHTPDGLCIRMPPAGLRAARSEFRFALAFTAILVFVTAIFVFALVGKPPKLIVAFGVVIALFWAGALGLLVEVWRRSRQMAIIDVVGETLLISTSKPGSGESFQIEKDNIKALGVGPSGVVVDDVPVMALRIDLGKPIQIGKARRRALKLFRERSEAELCDIADQLRLALGITVAEGRGWREDAASSRAPGRSARIR